MTKITIGARGSKLSLAYVAVVKELLIKNNIELKEDNIEFIKAAENQLNKTEVSDQSKFLIDQKIEVLRSIN